LFFEFLAVFGRKWDQTETVPHRLLIAFRAQKQMTAVNSRLRLGGHGQGRLALDNPLDLREQALRCRLLLSIAIVPEVREQLQVWARDFDDIADTMEAQQSEECDAC
jgi:hypothetical protein